MATYYIYIYIYYSDIVSCPRTWSEVRDPEELFSMLLDSTTPLHLQAWLHSPRTMVNAT